MFILVTTPTISEASGNCATRTFRNLYDFFKKIIYNQLLSNEVPLEQTNYLHGASMVNWTTMLVKYAEIMKFYHLRLKFYQSIYLYYKKTETKLFHCPKTYKVTASKTKEKTTKKNKSL